MSATKVKKKSSLKNLDDNFSRINALARNSRHNKIISKMVNPETGRLKGNFIFDPNHSWYCIGKSYFKTSNYEAAAKAFLKSLKANSEDGQAWLALGNCYSESRRYLSAARAYNRGIESKHNSSILPALYYNLGNALFDQKKYTAAIEYYDKVIRRKDKIGKQARENLDLAQFAKIHEFLDNKQYKKIILEIMNPVTGRLRPHFNFSASYSWYCVGYSCYEISNYKLAIKALLKFLRYNSEDGQAWFVLGNSYFELKKYLSAAWAYDRGIKSKNNLCVLPSLYYNLGNTLFTLRKYNDAIKYYKKVTRRKDDIGKQAKENLQQANENLRFTRFKKS